MITVKNLYKSIEGHEVISDLSLYVETGSIYGLIGQNGAGKTTVIKQVAGVLKPDSGQVLYDGVSVWENPSVKDRIGYIPDDLNLLPLYTLKDAAGFISSIYSEWDNGRFDELSNLFGFNLKMKLKYLSKGQQKQAAFLLMLSTHPDYILLDEPVDGLDPVVRSIVWREMKKDVAENKTSIIVSSHNLREVENICDVVGIIENGRMITEQKLDELKNNMHKIQVVLPGRPDAADKLEEAGIEVLKAENVGSVASVVVKGDKNDIRKKMESLSPVVLDILPMTLEEIFIVEQEVSHGVKNIFI